ncbi:MAG TPA: hypothetical protein VGS22_02115 [Thermoanaerobaculia bacterium]|nr:hypothetical protein [Thermoanaerobaculia bacterium]
MALAVETFLARELRQTSPDGDWQEGIWLPAPEERRACCEEIAPTAANKQALEAHCRTILHVAALFDVPATVLKRAVRVERERVAHRGSDKPQAEVFFEASSAAREEAYAQLRKEATRFVPVQERLQAIGKEDPEALAALLEAAGIGLERYVLALEYATQTETAYRFAQAARDKFRSFQEGTA